jgi:hypothetical protein
MAIRAKGQHNTSRIHQSRKLIIVVWIFIRILKQEVFRKYNELILSCLKINQNMTVSKMNSLKNIIGHKENRSRNKTDFYIN